MTDIKTLVVATYFVLLSSAAPAGAEPLARLGIEDSPPPLEPMAWIKDGPVARFQAGQVYVIYFFATWCGPSRQSMRQMSGLARQYAEDVTIVGVNVRESERGEATVGFVSRFVDEHAADLDHVVAMDDPERTPLFESWMRAAGMFGTPTAFIIGRDGRIAYIGLPIDDTAAYTFEQALADAIEGRSDFEAARAVHADTTYQIAEHLESKKVLEPVHAARSSGDHAAVVRAIDRIVSDRPDYRLRTLQIRLSALLHLDEAAALAFAEQELNFVDNSDDARAHRAEIVGGIGRAIASVPELSPEAYARARGYIREALDTAPEGYTALLNWMSVAGLEHSLGNIDAAIVAQERVIELARTVSEVPVDALRELERTLSDYRSQR